MIYEYKCPQCHWPRTATQRGDRLDASCTACGYIGPLHRVFSISVKPVMQEHFNTTLGKPVSDMKRFTAELRAAGEQAEEQTGIPHRYAPVEYGDAAAVGATAEGIYESNVVRSRRGDPLLPAIDTV